MFNLNFYFLTILLSMITMTIGAAGVSKETEETETVISFMGMLKANAFFLILVTAGCAVMVGATLILLKSLC